MADGFEMNKQDFNEWASKKETINNKDQKEDIKKLAEKLTSENKISKNLSKKIKLIHDR